MILPINTAETTYDAAASAALRWELVAIRDEAISKSNFKDAVVLSHAIAWMYAVLMKAQDEVTHAPTPAHQPSPSLPPDGLGVSPPPSQGSDQDSPRLDRG